MNLLAVQYTGDLSIQLPSLVVKNLDLRRTASPLLDQGSPFNYVQEIVDVDREVVEASHRAGKGGHECDRQADCPPLTLTLSLTSRSFTGLYSSAIEVRIKSGQATEKYA